MTGRSTVEQGDKALRKFRNDARFANSVEEYMLRITIGKERR